MANDPTFYRFHLKSYDTTSKLLKNWGNWHYSLCVVFIIFLQYEFFSISSAKMSLDVSNLLVSFDFYAYMLLGDMLMCLIYVINNFHCLCYIHTGRHMKFQQKRNKCKKVKFKTLITPKHAQWPQIPLIFSQTFFKVEIPPKMTLVLNMSLCGNI
jgi:hypothetical protein